MKKILNFSHFKGDLLGGLTAGVVALPLALAFGEQSGLGAAAGLYGAAFLAFFASLFGGTSSQISGPTAPMTAVSMILIANVLQSFEGRMEQALPVILIVFLLAGIFQILMGLLRLGSFIKFIPSTVVSGFMTGIGVMILITQLLPAIGYYTVEDQEVIDSFKPHAEELILDRILKEEAQDGILVLEEFKETISRAEDITEEDILTEARLLAANASKGVIGSIQYYIKGLQNINWIELILTAITIIIIYGFKRITSLIPSALVALLVVSASAYFLNLNYIKIQEIPGGYPILHLEMFTDFSLSSITPYLVTALMLALLGAIDSLLTSVVADNMTKTRHNSNRELIGQGIGNSIASMFSGLPGAGATIRTVVNIQSGGRTKLSGMIAGILLFVMVIALGPIASAIPAAVLAGILITVGFGVIDYKGLKVFPRMETSEKVIFLTVLILTVFWQLVYAVGIGLMMASFVFLKHMSDISARQSEVTDLEKQKEKDPNWLDELGIAEEISKRVYFKHLNGPMFFGFVSHFKDLVDGLPVMDILVIRMEKVPFIDHSGVTAIESAIQVLHRQNVVVAISGANKQVADMLRKMKIIPNMVGEQHVFEQFKECREWLQAILKNQDGINREVSNLVTKDK